MTRILLVSLMALALLSPSATEPAADAPSAGGGDATTTEDPPEGYYAFVESPNATPPRVRPPPYRQSTLECGERAGAAAGPKVSAANLCGDLNRGLIPRNPMGQNPGGEPYPFELIRNHTLKFLSRTLPVLRADDTLPRVAHLQGEQPSSGNVRKRRSSPDTPVADLPQEHRSADGVDVPRESSKFCANGGV